MVKRIGAVVATVVMTVLLSAPAFAGSWTSHFAGWGIGDQSRNWTDSNSPSNSTVLSIKQCTYSVTTAEKWMAFRLYRDDFWTPDETYERKGVDCWATSAVHTTSWGSKGKGDFFWRIASICGFEHNAFADTPYVRMDY